MNIGIAGLGLIGGSLGRAVKKKTNHKVFAFDLDPAIMAEGALLNAYDGELNEESAKDLDIFITALYPAAAEESIIRFQKYLPVGCIVADCAGIKRSITTFMEKQSESYPDLCYIGFHPMAGREFSGIGHSTPTLFEKATGIIVPVTKDLEKLSVFKAFLLETGFEGVVLAKPDEHDDMIAYTSQLAHIVSGAYVKNDKAYSHYGFSAGSFRDMTRVAKMNASMWTELMLNNADYLGEEIDNLIANLKEYREALKNKDENALKTLLQEGSDIKNEIESRRKSKLALSFKRKLTEG